VRGWDEYADRWASLHGGVDPRTARPEIRYWLRAAYHVAWVLARLRVPPGAVTATGLLAGALTPVFAARHGGWPAVAALLVLGSGVTDTLDGAVAVVADRATPLGYVYDAVTDRVVEACWLVALWLTGVPGWLVASCLGVAWLHEYVRARSVAAGMTEVGTVTVAERPTRVALAATGLLFAAVGQLFSAGVSTGSATLATAVWLALGLIGLVQLMRAVLRGLREVAPGDGGPGADRPGGDGGAVAPGAVDADPLASAPTQDLPPEPATLKLDPEDR
jgi:phosphatidylglycerophosphate synthase